MENVKIVYDDEKKCADCPMRYICEIATKGKCPYEGEKDGEVQDR